MTNFTAQDVLQTLLVLPHFLPVLVAPGYLLGSSTNLLDFRERRFSEQTLLAIVLSCAISPYLIATMGRFMSIGHISLVFGLLGVACLGQLILERRRVKSRIHSQMHSTTAAALTLAAFWTLLALISLPDLQIGNALYSTPATFDHIFRSNFIASILQHGVPPANPFFYPGHLVQLRYYYYWNALCAIPAYTSASSPRIALYGSCIWSGYCLAALIPIFLKHFVNRQINLRVTSLIGMALLGITGLDLIPTLFTAALHVRPPFADMEWWNPNQVTSWLDSFLWVPHHVASLVACLVGFLLLSKGLDTQIIRKRLVLLAVSAISFASAEGLSVYVAFTFSIFLVFWTIALTLRGRRMASIHCLLVGLTAAMLSVGYFADLRAPASTAGNSPISFVSLASHELPFFFASSPEAFSGNSHFLKLLWTCVLILLTLFLELGVYFAVGVLQFNLDPKPLRPLSDQQLALWLMAAASLSVMTFLKSSVIQNNDLGWRAALPLQFVLLLWTAISLADRWRPPQSERSSALKQKFSLGKTMAALLLIGGASSLYQLCMSRTYTILSDRYHWANDLFLAPGYDAFRIRQAYAQVDQIATPRAVLLYNPKSHWAAQLLSDSRYQQADAFAASCGTAYGGSLEECGKTEKEIDPIFNPAPGKALNAPEISQITNQLRVDLLVVTIDDPIWNDKRSWIWKENPVIQNDVVRVYAPDVWLQQHR